MGRRSLVTRHLSLVIGNLQKGHTMRRRLFTPYALAAVLIVLGLVLVILYGARSLRSFREFQYIRAQGLDRGVANVDAIQPWMPIRYVAVAYAVPEEYIFAQLGIPYDRRNSNATLGRLNHEYGLGESPGEGQPLIVARVAEAIAAYQADPVVTGLDDVRPWMTIRYIANSTGAPEEYLLEQIGVGPEGDHAVMPLDRLAEVIRFQGGPRGLADAIQAALRRYEGAP
jgi:hypothetical protein